MYWPCLGSEGINVSKQTLYLTEMPHSDIDSKSKRKWELVDYTHQIDKKKLSISGCQHSAMRHNRLMASIVWIGYVHVVFLELK